VGRKGKNNWLCSTQGPKLKVEGRRWWQSAWEIAGRSHQRMVVKQSEQSGSEQHLTPAYNLTGPDRTGTAPLRLFQAETPVTPVTLIPAALSLL